MAKNIKSIFITLPQRDRPSDVPPFGAMAVINSLRKAGYKDILLYNIDVLRPSGKMLKNSCAIVLFMQERIGWMYVWVKKLREFI